MYHKLASKKVNNNSIRADDASLLFLSKYCLCVWPHPYLWLCTNSSNRPRKHFLTLRNSGLCRYLSVWSGGESQEWGEREEMWALTWLTKQEQVQDFFLHKLWISACFYGRQLASNHPSLRQLPATLHICIFIMCMHGEERERKKARRGTVYRETFFHSELKHCLPSCHGRYGRRFSSEMSQVCF